MVVTVGVGVVATVGVGVVATVGLGVVVTVGVGVVASVVWRICHTHGVPGREPHLLHLAGRVTHLSVVTLTPRQNRTFYK